MTHKDFFFKILDILEDNNIEYCLFAGTLLGAIRDKDFLPGDAKDTDIAIDDSHYWEVRYLMNKYILKEKFKWYSILRKEISVCDNRNDYKVDMFFMEKSNELYNVYSYKRNETDRKWNHEWKSTFPNSAFFPSKNIKFLGRKVSIPNDFELILKTEYDDWKTPNPEWKSSDETVLNADLEYKGFYPAGIDICTYRIDTTEYDVGFIVINFLRTDSTKKCILSLKKYYPNVKIYIADQDEPCREMIQFYEENYVEYYYVPYDCGIGYCRNLLLTKVKEPFLLWGDNDFVFDKNSNLSSGITILEHNKNIGFVGGGVIRNDTLGHYERILSYSAEYGILIYVPLELTEPEVHILGDISFYYCDLTYNYVLCKTKVLQENSKLRWDERLKVAYEHTSLFLCLKQFSDYKVVYCPSMVVIHEHSFSNQRYNKLRTRTNADKVFAEIWGLKMNFTIGKGREIYSKHELTTDKQLEETIFNEETSVQINPPIDNTITDMIIKPPVVDIEAKTQHFLTVLNDNKINFWLLKQTCLDCIKYGKILSENIILGVNNENIKNDILRINDAMKMDLKLTIIIEKRQTKQFNLYGINMLVPKPVVTYLEREFGIPFNDLMKKHE